MQYSKELENFRQKNPKRLEELAYDAIYVDEGQDFAQEEFGLLKDLCRRHVPDGEPSLFIFYDDAQNLYGRARPKWSTLNLNVRGNRSSVMSQCFRNTRPIVEAAFNVLYGTRCTERARVPSRAYGDIAGLEQKGLIHNDCHFLCRMHPCHRTSRGFCTRQRRFGDRVSTGAGPLSESLAANENRTWVFGIIGITRRNSSGAGG
jgi:hypothetical protein